MRLQNWESALAAVVQSRRCRPFVWGEHDCCLFAADCAQAITGIDWAAEFRGTYDSAVGAAKQISKRGGFESMITGLLGDPIAVGLARRGDVVMVTQDGHPALAVCCGATVLAAGINGLISRQLSDGLLAWRVA